MDYKLSRRARADIKEIVRYTDLTFGQAQTDRYLDGLYYSFDLLTDNPEMGREWSAGKRRYVYRKHIVYYRIVDGGVLITQIRHSAMRQP